MTTGSVSAAYYADFSGLEALKKTAKEQDPKAVRQAARQFESLLTGMLLKSMRAAKLGNGLGDSQETAFYQDMLDQQMAVQLSQGKGLGLADLLVQQLTRSGLGRPAAAAAANAGVAPAAASDGPSTAPTDAAGRAPPAVAAVTAAEPAPPATPLAMPAPTAPVALPVAMTADPADDRAGFIRRIESYAEHAAQRLGVAAETVIAHAALETGWGRHVPGADVGNSSFNLFGIKAGGRWSGAAVTMPTVEYQAGSPATIEQPFRRYASLSQGIDDYVALLERSPRYRAALGTGADSGAFARGLARGGYATDPAYAQKLSAMAEQVRALRQRPAVAPFERIVGQPTPRGVTSA